MNVIEKTKKREKNFIHFAIQQLIYGKVISFSSNIHYWRDVEIMAKEA